MVEHNDRFTLHALYNSLHFPLAWDVFGVNIRSRDFLGFAGSPRDFF